MLARLGAERRPEPDPAADPAREELRALVQRRDQLTRMQAQEKNRLSACTPALVARDIRAELEGLARRVARIEAAIADHLARYPALAAAERLLRSIPGFGPVTAMTLLAHLAELGQIDRREIASLGGLAPRAHDSGKFRGKRFIGDGRRHVRRALFMAAMGAMRHPGFLADFVARMKAAGKPGKVILIAVARRLLTIANAGREDRRAGRGVGLGQVDAGSRRGRAVAGDRRPGAARRHRRTAPAASGKAAPDGLPGSVLLLGPADEHR